MKLMQEIQNTINLLSGDISDEATEELQGHLYSLLEMRRNQLKTEGDDKPDEEENDTVDWWANALKSLIQEWNKKPLTKECLNGGGWFMRSASEEDRNAFKALGIPVSLSAWGASGDDICCAVKNGFVAVGVFENLPDIGNGFKEIIRIGNNFYYKD